MAKRTSKPSLKTMSHKDLSALVSKNTQLNPTPHGGDTLDPYSVPQPGDPSTQLFANKDTNE